MCSYTHILLDSVWIVKAKHSLTDDHCSQLDTASLENRESHSDDKNEWPASLTITITSVPPEIDTSAFSRVLQYTLTHKVE